MNSVNTEPNELAPFPEKPSPADVLRLGVLAAAMGNLAAVEANTVGGPSSQVAA